MGGTVPPSFRSNTNGFGSRLAAANFRAIFFGIPESFPNSLLFGFRSDASVLTEFLLPAE